MATYGGGAGLCVSVCVEGLPSEKPWDVCGVCDTPELWCWRGAAGLRPVRTCTTHPRVSVAKYLYIYMYVAPAGAGATGCATESLHP